MSRRRLSRHWLVLIHESAKVAFTAKVSPETLVYGQVCDYARVLDHACVWAIAKVSGHATITGHSRVLDCTPVCGDAIVEDTITIVSSLIKDQVHLKGSGVIKGSILEGHVRTTLFNCQVKDIHW